MESYIEGYNNNHLFETQDIIAAIELISILVIGIIFLIIRSKKKGKYEFKEKVTGYWREIPFNKDVNTAYFMLHYFSNISKVKLNNGLLGAYLLTWYQKGYIDIIEDNRILSSNQPYKIDLKDGNWPKTKLEEELYKILEEAAGKNRIIERKELKNWIEACSFEMEWWFDRVIYSVMDNLEQNNLLSKNATRREMRKEYISPVLFEEYKKLLGLKNFLVDYSSMKEKEHIEVYIWEEYLIFAELLGIADKLKENIHSLYPNMKVTITNFSSNTNDNYMWKTILGTILTNIMIYVVTYFMIMLTLNGNINIALIAILLFIEPIVFYYGIYIRYKRVKQHYLKEKIKKMNTPAIARVTEIDQIERNEDRPDQALVSYEFTANGRQIRGSTWIKFIFFKPRVGKKLKIYYNPNDPTTNESEAEKKEDSIFGFIIYSAIILGLMFGFLLIILLVMNRY